ncbi:MAG: KH domain-containing protein [Halobacteriota archaeon]|nr:KH domain-containing protein [Halobacteriota archaeon]
MNEDSDSTGVYSTSVKIPNDRIGVVIGPEGSIKKIIESKSCSQLEIDGETGNVNIISSGDPIGGMRASEVVKAIGRGFSPEKALRLFDDDVLMLDVIDISKVASTPKEMKRVKGRIIGKEGKSRSVIESLTGSKLSIYGKTVSVLGYPEQIDMVRDALNMLIDGAPHGHVYAFLEKKRKNLREFG